MSISKEKLEELEKRLKKLGATGPNLIEKFVLGSGKGGQKVNKTTSCVYLKHVPTGIEVKCQKERSTVLNRYYARKMLCEKLEKKLHDIQSAKDKLMHKVRKQKKRRSRRQQQKLVDDKRHLSQKKALRKPPSGLE